MRSSYSVSQWSALFALRLFMGCYLLYLGLFALGVLGWDEPRQAPVGSLMLHYLAQYEPAPRFVAAAESVYATVLTFLGCALVLGFYERAASALGLLLLLSEAILEAPLFTATSVFACLVLMSEPIAAVIAVAVTFAFPTGHVLGLDALRRRQGGMAPVMDSGVVLEPASGSEYTDEAEPAQVDVLRMPTAGQSRRLSVVSGESP